MEFIIKMIVFGVLVGIAIFCVKIVQPPQYLWGAVFGVLAVLVFIDNH